MKKLKLRESPSPLGLYTRFLSEGWLCASHLPTDRWANKEEPNRRGGKTDSKLFLEIGCKLQPTPKIEAFGYWAASNSIRNCRDTAKALTKRRQPIAQLARHRATRPAETTWTSYNSTNFSFSLNPHRQRVRFPNRT